MLFQQIHIRVSQKILLVTRAYSLSEQQATKNCEAFVRMAQFVVFPSFIFDLVVFSPNQPFMREFSREFAQLYILTYIIY